MNKQDKPAGGDDRMNGKSDLKSVFRETEGAARQKGNAPFFPKAVDTCYY